jgi:hypothetical protein
MELEILKKIYFLELNLKIQAPGKNFQAPRRPGALYLSTPDRTEVHARKLHSMSRTSKQYF